MLIDSIAVIVSGAGTILLGTEKLRGNRKRNRLIDQHDLIDNATSFNAQLLARIKELEEKITHLESNIKQVQGDAIQAHQEAAEWKVKYEIEHRLRVEAEEKLAHLLAGRRSLPETSSE